MPSSSKHTRGSKPRLADKTVEELRALAKSLGLTKYSKLIKSQLLQLISTASRPSTTRAASPKATTKKLTKKQKTVRHRAKAKSVQPHPPPVTRKPRSAGRPDLSITATKASPGKVTTTLPPTGGEDDTATAPGIPPRPPVEAPMLTLRGQKPGVLHAAWSIDPTRSMPLPYLRLRILKAGVDHTGLIDEIPLPGLQGSRYVHVATEFNDTPLRGEIGYHSSDGRFITMLRHTDVRLPSRLAAGRGDPQWWISETDFRELYVRSGGIAEGSALVWRTSFSSR